MSLYPPKHHQEYNIENIKEVAKEYPLATLISVKDNIPYITHAPLIFDGEQLVGHIDKNNPHIELLQNNHPIALIFQGPQTYISPSIYTTEQLPTWNYIIAHANGTTSKIEDIEAVKKSMIKMTEFLESPDHKYVLEQSNRRMDSAVGYVHCFEITIKSWEGKFKLSQDKIPADIENAKQQLIKSNQKNIAHFVNQLFTKHF